jgi:hypothetical protein
VPSIGVFPRLKEKTPARKKRRVVPPRKKRRGLSGKATISSSNMALLSGGCSPPH